MSSLPNHTRRTGGKLELDSPLGTAATLHESLHEHTENDGANEPTKLREERALNRAKKGLADDLDITAGLPVQQWRPQLVNIPIGRPQNKRRRELKPEEEPFKRCLMPPGSEHYHPWNQMMIRARKTPIWPTEIFGPDPDGPDDAFDDEDDNYEATTNITMWKMMRVPPGQEVKEPEFLAPRRPGLISKAEDDPMYQHAFNWIYNTPFQVVRVDPDGTRRVYNVIAPPGTSARAEKKFGDAILHPQERPAPGTIIDGLGVANEEGVLIFNDLPTATPARRRPPPPKRKAKGPGRGRKKKVSLEDGSGTPLATDVADNGEDGEHDGDDHEGDESDGEMGDVHESTAADATDAMEITEATDAPNAPDASGTTLANKIGEPVDPIVEVAANVATAESAPTPPLEAPAVNATGDVEPPSEMEIDANVVAEVVEQTHRYVEKPECVQQ